MNSKDYLNDISEIKTLMKRSSRFISLSGLSGIMAGIYAFIGAAIAYNLVTNSEGHIADLDEHTTQLVLLDLVLVATLSIGTAVFLSTRKARQNGEKIWDATSKRMVLNFLIPLVTGGLYILINLDQHHYGQSSALMLIFYGLALVSASRYSLGDIRYLGLIEIVLGLICAVFPEYGFWLWVIGFGFFHIIYGSYMYFKYDRTHKI